MTDKQPEALRLAQCIDFPSVHLGHAAAAELRRLYASEASLREQNTYLDRKLAEMEKALGQAVEAMELSLWAINSIATDEEITAFDKSFKNATKALKGAA